MNSNPETWDIPTLDPAKQARRADLPQRWTAWGSVARTPGRGAGQGVHFYVSDHHFTGLVRQPESLIAFAPTVAVEPNFSTHPGMPLALALGLTYQKRRIARTWQDAGIPILVDLNVAVEDRYRAVNLIGVPEGWASYATRHHRDTGIDALDADLDVAQRHWQRGGCAGGEFLFLVYGGGAKVRDHCAAKGWAWVPEQSDVARGRFTVEAEGGTPCTEADGRHG